MNIFRLSDCPVEAAFFMQDLHIRKQVVETVQLLANGYSLEQLQDAPKTQTGNVRKYSHTHHPISKWTKETYGNFNWVARHAVALDEEYYYRFSKIHFCHHFIKWNWDTYHPANVNTSLAQTEQPQCFKKYPQCIVPGDPVAGYRNYYRTAKKTFDMRGKIVHATWTRRDVPEWFK